MNGEEEAGLREPLLPSPSPAPVSQPQPLPPPKLSNTLQPPAPSSFPAGALVPAGSLFDARHTPLLRSTLRSLAWLVARQAFLFTLLLLLFFSSGWSPNRADRLARLRVALVDADGGRVGAAVASAASALPYSLVVLPGDTGLGELLRRTDRGDFSAAWRVREGASASLDAAWRTPGAGYDPRAAVAFAYDEGRAGSKGAQQPASATAGCGPSAGLVSCF